MNIHHKTIHFAHKLTEQLSFFNIDIWQILLEDGGNFGAEGGGRFGGDNCD